MRIRKISRHFRVILGIVFFQNLIICVDEIFSGMKVHVMQSPSILELC